MELQPSPFWAKGQTALRQMIADQSGSEDRALNGAIVGVDNVAVPGHTGTALLITAVMLGCHMEHERTADFANRALRGLRWFESWGLNGNNRLSAPDCNPDSGPDTAFVVQLFGCLLEALAALPDLELQEYREAIKLLKKLQDRMVRGLRGAGFHTPNHRWVTASAMAWGCRRNPDPVLKAELDAYLSEGPDGDQEGFYPERSSAIYDAVSNRSFQLLNSWAGWPDGLPAVRKNLQLIHCLLNNDGKVETLLSTRQDREKPIIPSSLLPCLLQAIADFPEDKQTLNETFSSIWQNSHQLDVSSMVHLMMVTLTLPDCGLPTANSLPDGEWWFRDNNYWRARRFGWGFNAVKDSVYPLQMHGPDGTVVKISCAQAYMGTGQFKGDTISAGTDVAWEMSHKARDVPFRPAYELPLGIRVTPEDYDDERNSRVLRLMPAASSTLKWEWCTDGAFLHWLSELSIPNVYAQIILDFPSGVVFKTDACQFRSVAGQVIFLKDLSTMELSGKSWSLTIGPGGSAHTMNPMRDALPSPVEGCRLVIALATPVAHVLTFKMKY